MAISTRKLVGFGGVAVLVATVQVAASFRRGDWSAMLDPEGWLWALTPAAFMGVWGWIALLISRQSDNKGASLGLVGLAALYFAIMAWFTADIILNGNSTSGIAFLLIPIFATVVMLPLIVLVIWLGPKVNEGRNDR
jgi:hypothetical protein